MSVITPQTLPNFQLKPRLFLTSSPSIPHFPAISSLSSSSSSSSSISCYNLPSKELKKGRRIPLMARASAAAAAATTSTTSGFNENISEILGDVSIFTAAGESVMFKELWDQKEGMAVVALLRHFGCPCCWELALTLKDAMPRFDAAGVKLIAVGVGTPDKARLLAERLPFPMDVLYADPNRKAYDVLGLYYGFGRTFFNPASVKVFSRYGALKKAVKNYTIKATPTDRSSVLQQGGIFVFKGKQLLYARKDEGTGDHAPLEDILDICCTAPVA